jgi:hypothetical protein
MQQKVLLGECCTPVMRAHHHNDSITFPVLGFCILHSTIVEGGASLHSLQTTMILPVSKSNNVPANSCKAHQIEDAHVSDMV